MTMMRRNLASRLTAPAGVRSGRWHHLADARIYMSHWVVEA